MNWASLVACVVWVTLQGLRRPLFLARANVGEDVEVVQPVEVMICGWDYLVAVLSGLLSTVCELQCFPNFTNAYNSFLERLPGTGLPIS